MPRPSLYVTEKKKTFRTDEHYEDVEEGVRC